MNEPSSEMQPLIPSRPLPKCGDGDCHAPEHQVSGPTGPALTEQLELNHVQHTCMAPWVRELKDVKQDMIDEAVRLDEDCIHVERVICGLIAGLNTKKKQVLFTITNVWSEEEINAAKARRAGKLQKVGP